MKQIHGHYLDVDRAMEIKRECVCWTCGREMERESVLTVALTLVRFHRCDINLSR